MTSPAAETSARERVGWLALLAVAIVAGAWLRWYQLGIQVLLDDEWHALHKLLASDAWGIATSFGYADHSIPLTLYYRFLLLHGGLTEWVMHLPMLVFGIALLVLAPLALRRETTLAVRATWVALLAISPLLVYHARIARPYALTGLLVPLALVAFRRWWQADRAAASWGATYVVATALAGWLHVTTLAFTLLPFAYEAVRSLASLRGGDRSGIGRAWRRLVALGLVTALALALVLAPPLLHDWASLGAKAGVHSVSFESVYRTLLMLFGIASPAALAIVGIVTVVGVRALWSRERELAAYLATVMLAGGAAIAAVRPMWIQHPLVLARYALPVLPFLLLFLAEGIVACLQRLPLAPLRVTATAAIAAALLWLGPIPGYFYYPNQFMGHPRFQFDYDPAHNPYVQQLPVNPVPEFYRALAQEPPATITLIEAPWSFDSTYEPHAWYQEIHRQYVKMGLVTTVCGVRSFGEYPDSVPGMRMRELVHLSKILAGKSYGADYLVMHLVPWRTPPDAQVDWPDVAACLPAIEAKLGPPVYRDSQITVFDLKSRPHP